MCGVAGIINPNDISKEKLFNNMKIMNFRGPDFQYVEERKDILMGHVRLSILDLTTNSNQPFYSLDSNLLISFNGEIYNYLELSKKFFSNTKIASDSVFLKKILAIKSLDEIVPMLEGMWVIVVYDIINRRLQIVRDRIGEKPLYYCLKKNSFYYSSNLKVLKNLLGNLEYDIEAFKQYFSFGYFGGSNSPLKGVKKLKAGYIMTFEKNNILFRKYWDIQSKKGNSFIEIPDKLESILDNVIKKEMISDVPIGSFLSGGIDSSLVTALMVKNAKKQINTFSIGFENNGFDESQHARKVANHLGTVHFEKIINNNDLFDSIPKFSEAYDEPFADSSAIPTLVLSEMARKHVTVALSGDGADELFGGYRRYFDTNKYWNKIEKIPYNFRSFSAIILKEFSSFFRFINTKESPIANKLLKYNNAIISKNINELYNNFIIYWSYSNIKTDEILDIQDMMRRDIKTYLVDDIMTKVDRATMFNSLESRAPFLNHNVVEYALNLNINELISNGYGKIPLRKILSKYVPDSIINRPKMGFGVPLNDWLNGPLKNDLFKKIDLIEDEIPEICFELDLRNQVDILLKNGHSLHKVWLVYSLGLWFDKWNDL